MDFTVFLIFGILAFIAFFGAEAAAATEEFREELQSALTLGALGAFIAECLLFIAHLLKAFF